LRANDSLADHQSRFYAEIRRLKQVVDLASSAQTMFLLDELLSGTNSHDRRIGAEGLLRGLLERGAIGLTTTHDLALTEIVASMGGKARNVHFEDQFESGSMKWDYRLRQGPIEKGNALELMRAVGLEV
jgi:DNA mismatch repair ATPase MutS